MQYTLKHGTQKQNEKKSNAQRELAMLYIVSISRTVWYFGRHRFWFFNFVQLFCYNWTIQIIIAQSPERARNQFAYNKWDFVVAKSPIMLLNKHWCPKCCWRVTVSRVSSPDWRNFKPKICRSSLLNQPNKKINK